MLEPEKAKEHLSTSRQLSTGKSWTAKREMGYHQDTIFVESCILLYKALLKEAKQILTYEPLKAARVCAIARKRAADGINFNQFVFKSMADLFNSFHGHFI